MNHRQVGKVSSVLESECHSLSNTSIDSRPLTSQEIGRTGRLTEPDRRRVDPSSL